MATQNEKTEIQRLLNRTPANRITISDITAGDTSNAIGAIQQTAKKDKAANYAVLLIKQ